MHWHQASWNCTLHCPEVSYLSHSWSVALPKLSSDLTPLPPDLQACGCLLGHRQRLAAQSHPLLHLEPGLPRHRFPGEGCSATGVSSSHVCHYLNELHTFLFIIWHLLTTALSMSQPSSKASKTSFNFLFIIWH